MDNIDTSVVIVNFNTKDITLNCIESVIKNTKDINFEIVIVDNGSTDGFVEEIKKKTYKNLKIIANKENKGFAEGNNQGTKSSTGRYVFFLNSDTVVNNNVIGELTRWMDQNPNVGISGCKLIGTDGFMQEPGGYFPSLLSVFSWMTIQDLPLVDRVIKPFHPLKKKAFVKGNKFFTKKQNLDWIIGADMFVRRDVLNQIGGWDNSYFMYTEDVDLCFRAKKRGWQVSYLPNWEIIHLGGASSGSIEFPLVSEYKSIKLFYQKHYPKWQYPIARLFLKLGALGRVILLGILEGRQSAAIYAKAFKVS
ncbi:glycosyltransferase family 2 protein [Candidatus Microgenomates bacterium]|nr:glycosyltransferase family 2 protein [Candidatus Microgenomates bacterium]